MKKPNTKLHSTVILKFQIPKDKKIYTHGKFLVFYMKLMRVCNIRAILTNWFKTKKKTHIFNSNNNNNEINSANNLSICSVYFLSFHFYFASFTPFPFLCELYDIFSMCSCWCWCYCCCYLSVYYFILFVLYTKLLLCCFFQFFLHSLLYSVPVCIRSIFVCIFFLLLHSSTMGNNTISLYGHGTKIMWMKIKKGKEKRQHLSLCICVWFLCNIQAYYRVIINRRIYEITRERRNTNTCASTQHTLSICRYMHITCV